jgi:hypothetical protein
MWPFSEKRQYTTFPSLAGISNKALMERKSSRTLGLGSNWKLRAQQNGPLAISRSTSLELSPQRTKFGLREQFQKLGEDNESAAM